LPKSSDRTICDGFVHLLQTNALARFTQNSLKTGHTEVSASQFNLIPEEDELDFPSANNT